MSRQPPKLFYSAQAVPAAADELPAQVFVNVQQRAQAVNSPTVSHGALEPMIRVETGPNCSKASTDSAELLDKRPEESQHGGQPNSCVVDASDAGVMEDKVSAGEELDGSGTQQPALDASSLDDRLDSHEMMGTARGALDSDMLVREMTEKLSSLAASSDTKSEDSELSDGKDPSHSQHESSEPIDTHKEINSAKISAQDSGPQLPLSARSMLVQLPDGHPPIQVTVQEFPPKPVPIEAKRMDSSSTEHGKLSSKACEVAEKWTFRAFGEIANLGTAKMDCEPSDCGEIVQSELTEGTPDLCRMPPVWLANSKPGEDALGPTFPERDAELCAGETAQPHPMPANQASGHMFTKADDSRAGGEKLAPTEAEPRKAARGSRAGGEKFAPSVAAEPTLVDIDLYVDDKRIQALRAQKPRLFEPPVGSPSWMEYFDHMGEQEQLKFAREVRRNLTSSRHEVAMPISACETEPTILATANAEDTGDLPAGAARPPEVWTQARSESLNFGLGKDWLRELRSALTAVARPCVCDVEEGTSSYNMENKMEVVQVTDLAVEKMDPWRTTPTPSITPRASSIANESNPSGRSKTPSGRTTWTKASNRRCERIIPAAGTVLYDGPPTWGHEPSWI